MFSLSAVLSEHLENFAQLFSPTLCMQCRTVLEDSEEYLCFVCEHRLAKSNFHYFAVNPLKAKFFGKVPVREAYAYMRFSHGNSVRKILHLLKYKNTPEIGEYFGEGFGFYLCENFELPKFDCIIPVPLHESKLRLRGYNQSECIAKGMSAGMEISLNTELLYRNRATETQTKKSTEERYKNMLNVFSLRENASGLHVLLVDDVITTGATLEACAQVLLNGGCASVSVAALAAGEQ